LLKFGILVFLISDFEKKLMKKNIMYPFLPEGREIKYVSANNVFIKLAKAYAEAQSLDKVMPGAAVVVYGDRVIGMGANGSDYHKIHKCERVVRGCKSGEGYELCEGCHPRNHSEATALAAASASYPHFNMWKADLYLWGHWWFCEPCWEAMIKACVRDVYLLENSEVLFNKEHPNNIVGKQFQK